MGYDKLSYNSGSNVLTNRDVAEAFPKMVVDIFPEIETVDKAVQVLEDGNIIIEYKNMYLSNGFEVTSQPLETGGTEENWVGAAPVVDRQRKDIDGRKSLMQEENVQVPNSLPFLAWTGVDGMFPTFKFPKDGSPTLVEKDGKLINQKMLVIPAKGLKIDKGRFIVDTNFGPENPAPEKSGIDGGSGYNEAKYLTLGSKHHFGNAGAKNAFYLKRGTSDDWRDWVINLMLIFYYKNHILSPTYEKRKSSGKTIANPFRLSFEFSKKEKYNERKSLLNTKINEIYSMKEDQVKLYFNSTFPSDKKTTAIVDMKAALANKMKQGNPQEMWDQISKVDTAINKHLQEVESFIDAKILVVQPFGSDTAIVGNAEIKGVPQTIAGKGKTLELAKVDVTSKWYADKNPIDVDFHGKIKAIKLAQDKANKPNKPNVADSKKAN